MTAPVLDCSIVTAWSLEDKQNPFAERAMQITTQRGALVPGIWCYELRNALVVKERRGRLSARDTRATLADLEDMSIARDLDHNDHSVLDLSRRHGLSVYQAAYLEVAVRRVLPLASLDHRLREAAKAHGIPQMELGTA